MNLYVIEKYKAVFPEFSGSYLTDRLIMYCLEKNGIFHAEVRRTEKGKPYIASIARKTEGKENEQKTFISVSHSGDVFVCLVASEPVGVDIQKERSGRFHQISHRYFTEGEQAYVEQHGEEGFFLLWTRKEAYSKFLGTGLEEIMKGTDVLSRQDVDFIDFQLEDGMTGSCCVAKGTDRELIMKKL